MMKRLLILGTILFAFCFSALAQENERFKTNPKQGDEEIEESQGDEESMVPNFRSKFGISERVVFGGNLSLNFGTNSYFYIAPTVGYRVNEKVLSGVGYIYQYAKFSSAINPLTGNFEPFDYQSTLHGPKAFVYFAPVEMLYLGGQMEFLKHDVIQDFSSGETSREWTPVLFLEIGYLQRAGKGQIQIGVKYNVLHDVDSPYSSAFIPTIGVFF